MECQRADVAGMDLLSAALPSASRASLHAAICDSCDMYIVGTRYHCTDTACEDFDLCDRCTLFEGKSHLQAHSLLVLQRPLASVSRLISTCHRADVTNDVCQCGSSRFARFVCSVCLVSVCDPCRSLHDASTVLIWFRLSSRRRLPTLPPAPTRAPTPPPPTPPRARPQRGTPCHPAPPRAKTLHRTKITGPVVFP